MGADWARLCRTRDIVVDGDHVTVLLGDERRHRVAVVEQESHLELTAVVDRHALAEVPNAPLLAWRRNRESGLVGFRIDSRGRLLAGSWVPKAGLTAEELHHYLRTTAVEADRFEFALTGRDVE